LEGRVHRRGRREYGIAVIARNQKHFTAKDAEEGKGTWYLVVGERIAVIAVIAGIARNRRNLKLNSNYRPR